MKVFSIVLFLLIHPAGYAQTAKIAKGLYNSSNSSQTNFQKASVEPARVRIGLKLVPYSKVMTNRADGKKKIDHVKGKVSTQTLRARLDKTNHFYVENWHIESKPVSWIRNTKRYKVRLTFFERYGAFGKLEKRLGSMELAGNLLKQQDNIYVLSGVAKKRFNDKFGAPTLDVISGYGKLPVAKNSRMPAKKLKSKG